MKHFKFPAIILLLLMVLSGFGQRGMGSSSSGRSSSFSSSSGRSSSSFSSGRSSSSFSSPRSTWSSTRSSEYKPSNPATAPRSNLSSNWKAGSAYSRPQSSTTVPPRTTVTSASRPTTRVSVTSNYRAGYRPPTTVRYYGNPYRYNNTSIYWYGGGYYSTYVGGPLILGTPSMPGYRDAYGYSPGYVDPDPVVVRSVFDPIGTFLVVIGIFVVIAIVIRLAL